MTYDDESVIDAPKPRIDWYVVAASTVTVAPALPAAPIVTVTDASAWARSSVVTYAAGGGGGPDASCAASGAGSASATGPESAAAWPASGTSVPESPGFVPASVEAPAPASVPGPPVNVDESGDEHPPSDATATATSAALMATSCTRGRSRPSSSAGTSSCESGSPGQ